MDGFECYKSYIALKNHFTVPAFDCFKHHPANVTEHSYERRKDRSAFQKIGKRSKPRQFILANLLEDPECFPVHLTTRTAEETYRDWQRRTEALYYNFTQELPKLKPDFNSNIALDKDTSHPHLLKALIRQEVSIETAAVIVELAKAAPYWQGKLGGDILWEEYKLRLMKYPPFLSYDKDKYRAAIVAAFQKGE